MKKKQKKPEEFTQNIWFLMIFCFNSLIKTLSFEEYSGPLVSYETHSDSLN